ncbi:hypothetical protein Theos_2550 (plasmid) [Thermus oshimai JL-2]|uniref:Uncharacterized protein n=2 Tax=Thermus oshimai TaxID=56957 RepID=K7RMC2_THEOS|nr:hypothetical protein Theos_2550 [Thermus oshimai JL-2]
MRTMRDTENARILASTTTRLLKEGLDERGRYAGGKWGGLYLRAPDIYFRILEKAGDKLVRLSEVAEVRRGFTTGANDFFYLKVLPHRPICPLCGKVHEKALTQEEEATYWAKGERPPEKALVAVRNGLGWEGYLEAAVLRPVFKSPKEAPALTVDVGNLNRVFLPASGDYQTLPLHARNYVDYGEQVPVVVARGRSRGQTLVGIPSLSTVQGRRPWWWLGEWPEAQVILPMFERARKYAFWNPHHAAIDNALYLVLPRYEIDVLRLLIALNSSLFALFKELLARPPEGGGGGPLQIKVYQYEEMPIPDPKLLSPPTQKPLEDFLARPIRNFWEEVGLTPPGFAGLPAPLPDRKALDDLVFDTLGLSEEERQEVYREAAQLVWERIAKARGDLEEEGGTG